MSNEHDIAIFGISVKLPLAETMDTFCRHLQEGVDGVRELPLSRKKDTDSYLRAVGNKHRNRHGRRTSFRRKQVRR
ncbi:hypothetical protein GK047_12030 [Paenibacillus sp. SYP-B3998]|uniref:Beta-ketoacyl synthase-like N-terminal domain-containing protein n=2 Tax=Paenibacillus sp. SYP-B3998 TaxID=2678564 RepID=A0A6G3ZX03_9BACL|nr:hypothetical protein [Paenibacillus sp. SYP-B3998]